MPEKNRSKRDEVVEHDRTGTSVATLKQAILDNLYYIAARTSAAATDMDYFMAVAYTVRDRMLAQWIATLDSYSRGDLRVVCYLSAEFLLRQHLRNNLLNLGWKRLSVMRQRAWCHRPRAAAMGRQPIQAPMAWSKR